MPIKTGRQLAQKFILIENFFSVQMNKLSRYLWAAEYVAVFYYNKWDIL